MSSGGMNELVKLEQELAQLRETNRLLCRELDEAQTAYEKADEERMRLRERVIALLARV